MDAKRGNILSVAKKEEDKTHRREAALKIFFREVPRQRGDGDTKKGTGRPAKSIVGGDGNGGGDRGRPFLA